MEPSYATVALDLDAVSEASIAMMTMLEDGGATGSLGAAAAALSFGRLMAPGSLDEKESIVFIREAFDFAAMFFASKVGPVQ